VDSAADFTVILNLVVTALGLIGVIFAIGRGAGIVVTKLAEHTEAIKELQVIVSNGLTQKVRHLEEMAERGSEEQAYQKGREK
jgi:hypothetical protein